MPSVSKDCKFSLICSSRAFMSCIVESISRVKNRAIHCHASEHGNSQTAFIEVLLFAVKKEDVYTKSNNFSFVHRLVWSLTS